MERLLWIADDRPRVARQIKAALESYCFFMELSDKSTEDLEDYFSDKTKRQIAFANANKFGDIIFSIIKKLDPKDEHLRYLVV